MTGQLDAAAVARLVKTCRLFASDLPGERAAAAAAAHRQLAAAGLDWPDVIGRSRDDAVQTEARRFDHSFRWGQNLMLAWRYPGDLRQWERRFVSELLATESPTAKQRGAGRDCSTAAGAGVPMMNNTLVPIRDFADRLRLHRAGREWRGDCPACGYRDAFVLKAGKRGPIGWCASCQDRAGVAAAIGGDPVQRDPAAAADEQAQRTRKRDAALRLWNGADLVRGTAAETYLGTRHVGHLATCPELRFRADTPHPQGGRLPALLALVRDAAGEPLAIHRTYLRRDGAGKADVEPAKASLGPVWGGAVRLAPLAAGLAIGEGVETAAAAGLLADLPAWAAISAGNLAAGLMLPAGVRSVLIAVDRDPAGERAAAAAAARWRAEGRTVRLLLPDRPGEDACDVLAARQRLATMEVAGHA